jgi:hypothetical protein
MAAGQPVISVDAKKELVGDFARAGRRLARKGAPVRARDHSFPGLETGHAIPCGIYDVAANEGFVNVGAGANAASLVVESVRRAGWPWPAGTRTRGPRACW